MPMHAQMKHILLQIYIQDLIPTLASFFVLPIIISAKLGIKSCRFAIECVSFICACMDIIS